MALRRGHVRLFIDDVLEVVNHRAVRDEGQRAGEVAVIKLARVRAEEPPAHGQAKNSIDMEWTSQASRLGQMYSNGTRSRLQ